MSRIPTDNDRVARSARFDEISRETEARYAAAREGGRIHERGVVPIGAVVHDVNGHPWVCVGHSTSTTGHPYYFVSSVAPNTKSHQVGIHWTYTCDFWLTLLHKFPDAERFSNG